MTTLAERASNVHASSGTVWSNTANIFDGTAGVDNDTVATWVSSTRNAVASIDVDGYSFASIPAGSTINSVTIRIRHSESNTTNISSVTIGQFTDSWVTTIGSALAVTRTTSLTSQDLTPSTLPTLTQLQSGYGLRVTINHGNNTNSATFSFALIDVTVDYTAATGGGGSTTPAVPATIVQRAAIIRASSW